MAAGSRKKEDEAQYAPSAAQLDAEERRANENRSSKVLSTAEIYEADESDSGRDYGDVDRTGYVGVNPEYQTYSSETEKPGVGEGVDDEIADDFVNAKDPEASTPDSLDDEDEGGGSDSPPSDSPSSPSGSES